MRVGVVGAGVVGAGVAQDLAGAEHDVVLIDLTDEILRAALARIAENLRMTRLLGGRSTARSSEDLLAAVTCSTDLGALEHCEFVIENIREKWADKAALYPRLDAASPQGCILAANTSAIPITRIASATTRPELVIGIHFMNPVPLVAAVELIPGVHTAPQTLARTRKLLATLGKEAIGVRDSPGFVSNRVLMLTINEAAELVHDGVADVADIDRVFTACFGHGMGPLATADLIGLDTVVDSIEVLYECYRDPKFRPSVTLRELVDAGRCGRKTGRGFYSY